MVGAAVEVAVPSGAEQPRGQFLCEGQGRDLQMLLCDVGTQGHSHGPGSTAHAGGFEGVAHLG